MLAKNFSKRENKQNSIFEKNSKFSINEQQHETLLKFEYFLLKY